MAARKSSTQSPWAAGCLRIGLEPAKSASWNAVSQIPMPTASAALMDLNDVVGQVPKF